MCCSRMPRYGHEGTNHNGKLNWARMLGCQGGCWQARQAAMTPPAILTLHDAIPRCCALRARCHLRRHHCGGSGCLGRLLPTPSPSWEIISLLLREVPPHSSPPCKQPSAQGWLPLLITALLLTAPNATSMLMWPDARQGQGRPMQKHRAGLAAALTCMLNRAWSGMKQLCTRY